MDKNQSHARRSFLKKLMLTSGAMAAGNYLSASDAEVRKIIGLSRNQSFAANDNVNVALIGAGSMGGADLNTALMVPGVKMVAACDLYTGRLEAARKKWGNDIFTTKSYKEILNRKDIDAVIIATPDHWHKQISIDAMNAGKHVYCEKPMVHSVGEGPDVIAAQKRTGKVFQVGSQGVSSLGNEKAKELLKAGAIGELNYAEGFWARRDPMAVWQYPIPDDASEQTVDWEAYISNTTKRPFDKMRFFRWRNYNDYGTGMAGDLYVHLFSSLHFITDSLGPDRIYSTGGLRFWNDGRECPDVQLGAFDYPKTAVHPAFNLSLRCNFVDGTSGTTYLKLVGSEGSMDVTWDDVTLKKNNLSDSGDPFLQKQKSTNVSEPRKKILPPRVITYKAEEGYKGGPYDHMANFFTAIRSGSNKNVAEDAVFGYRAAAPALLCNDSLREKKPMHWDPVNMKKL
ncbi:MAG: Gfo/Idh/MocA family oxidoreductase [Niabella sp.]